MGAWGFGILQSDAACDAQCSVQDRDHNLLPKFKKASERDTIIKATKGAVEKMAIAQTFYDNGYTLGNVKMIIKDAIKEELKDEMLETWQKPFTRKRELLAFALRMGIKIGS